MPRPEDVVDADDVLVVEAQQDLYFPQRALAVGLVLERADLLDGYALAGHVVQSGAGAERGNTGQASCYTLRDSLTHTMTLSVREGVAHY